MEAKEDPQVTAAIPVAGANNVPPADPRLLIVPRRRQSSIPTHSAKGTDSTHSSVDEGKIRANPQQQPPQQHQPPPPPPPPPPAAAAAAASSVTETAVLDEEKIQSTIDMSINPADVLSGRGKQSFNHVGNKYFREAIAASLEEYMQKQSRFEKSLVVQNIVDEIHGRGGRFLKQDSRTGRYTIELTMTQSREKVGHAIRDAATLHASKIRQQQYQTAPPPPLSQRHQQAGSYSYHDDTDPNVAHQRHVASAAAPTFSAAAAAAATAAATGTTSRKPAAKRPRQQHQQLQPPRGSLGSTASIFSMASDDMLSPISGRAIRSNMNHNNNNPNLLLLDQSPIQYSNTLTQQQRPGFYHSDSASPNTSSTSLYRFDPMVYPNSRDRGSDLTGSFTGGGANMLATDSLSISQQPASSDFTISPQLYQERQQLRQQIYQQQLVRQQIGETTDPFSYSNFPSQHLSNYNIPIPQPPPASMPQTADATTLPPKIKPDTGMAPSQQQQQSRRIQRPFLPSSYHMSQSIMTGHAPSASLSSLDAYTQLLVQEQQDRFYREYQAAQNRPLTFMGQSLPRPPQNNDDNDVFLEAIDSVLGPMDPDNNNHNYDDGLQPPQQPPQPQRSDRTGDNVTTSLHPQQRMSEGHGMQQQPHDPLQGQQLDSPSDSLEEEEGLASSLPPTTSH